MVGTSPEIESVFVFFPFLGLFPPLICKPLLGSFPNKSSAHNTSLSSDSGEPNIRQRASSRAVLFPGGLGVEGEES